MTSDNEDFDDRCSSYSSSSDCIDDCFYEEYVLKHIQAAYEKFKDIENIFFKNLITVWYLIDIITIAPQFLEDNYSNWDFFVKLIKEFDNENHKRSDCCFDYKMHNIRTSLMETVKLEMELSKYLRAPLDNSMLPRLKEITRHYENCRGVCKTSVKSLFRCLSRSIKMD